MICLLLAAGLIVSLPLPVQGRRWMEDWGLTLHLATAGVAVTLGFLCWRLRGAIRDAEPGTRHGWASVGVAGLSLGLAHAHHSWATMVSSTDARMLPVAEWGYLMGMTALIVGIGYRCRTVRVQSWIPDADAALVLSAAATLLLMFVVRPAWLDPTLGWMGRALVLVHFLGCMGLALAVRVAALWIPRSRGEQIETNFLAGGMLVLAITNAARIYLENVALKSGLISLQPAWLLAFALMTVGVICGYLRPLNEEVTAPPRGIVLSLAATPYGALGRFLLTTLAVVGAAGTVILSQYVAPDQPSVFSLAVALGLVGGLIARQTDSVWRTAREQLEREIRQRRLEEQVALLSGVVRRLNSTYHVGGALSDVLADTLQATGAEAAALWLPEPEGTRLQLLEAISLPPGVTEQELLDRIARAPHTGPTAEFTELIQGQLWYWLAVRLGLEEGDRGHLLLLKQSGPFGDLERAIGQAVAIDIGSGLRGVRMVSEARRLADRDPVTELLNHRAIHQRLASEISRAERQGTPLAVVMMDLDDFKFFNDTYGHPKGDEVLKRVASVLSRSCRGYDMVGRYGGDEFIALLPGCDLEGALQFVERIRERLAREKFRVSGSQAIPIHLCYGIAVFPEDSTNPHELVARADANLYEAKHAGGDAVTTSRYAARSAHMRSVSGFSLLEAMVIAVDNKDRYTRRHSEEVAEFSCAIATAMGLSEDTVRLIRLSALVHDVGKIGIPDAILRKPGALSEEESNVMKQHPVLGALIVGALPNLAGVVDGVRSHHERWDGGGYPDGLKGEEIPLIGRIMAVADAFSAMTTTRPYRKGMPLEEAITELERGAGKQFDPQIVPVFVRLLREGVVRPRGDRPIPAEYQLVGA